MVKKYRLEAVLKAIPALFFEVSRDGTYLDANVPDTSLLHKPLEDLIGKRVVDELPLDAAHEIMAAIGEADESGFSSGRKYVLEVPAGKRWFEISVSVMTGIAGMPAVPRFMVVCKDITDQCLMMEKLVQREMEWRIMFEQAPVGVVMVGMDKRFIKCNAAFSRFIGYGSDELTGKMIRDITHPDDVGIGIDELKKLTEGIPSVPSVRKRYVRKDGAIVWGETSIQLVRDSSGKPLHFLPVITDITERMILEDELKGREILFRTLATVLPVGVYQTDPTGNCLYANPCWCEMAGFDMEAAKGDGWAKGLHPEDREMVFSAWQKMTESNGEWGLDYRFMTGTGKITWVHGLATPLRDEKGSLTGYVGVNIDITNQKAVTSELENAFAENRRLLRELQHRAKNGFSMVSGMIDLMANSPVTAETKNVLDELHVRVLAVSELYSILYSQNAVSDVSLDDYIRRIVGILSGLSPEIRFVSDLEALTVSTKKASPIGLIVTELLTNAIKYAFAGKKPGTIEIKLGKTEGRAVVSVHDDGVGLPDGFDPVRDGDIGMSIVRGLAAQIGGAFSVDRAIIGTHCVLEFPLTEEIK